MRVCEVCGTEEAGQNAESESTQVRMLHLCVHCRNDLKFESVKDEDLL